MTVTAALLAAVVGITLGLFGGGGAILTVPMFVYLLGVPVKSAVPMSLIVVGASSALGAAERWRSGRLDARRGLGFGIAAMAGAYTGANIGLRIAERTQLIVFALVVIAAAIGMFIMATRPAVPRGAANAAVALGVFAAIGILTGFIGIGGGFLFVPALVVLCGVPMLEATGLSLMVIALNALAGVAGYHGHVPIAWAMTLSFTAVVVVSTIVAGRFAQRIPMALHQRAFAGVLLIVGALVLFENLL